MLSATFALSNDPLQDGCFPFAHLPPVSYLLQGFELLPVSGVWWLLWIICAPHPLPAQDQVTLATDVCKVPGARSPGAEPQGTAHSALILPERRGLSSGYPSWQAALSKHGPLCRLSFSFSFSPSLHTQLSFPLAPLDSQTRMSWPKTGVVYVSQASWQSHPVHICDAMEHFAR